MKILMQKHLGTLRPVDTAGEEELQQLKGGPVMVEIKQPRNANHHRLYWALINIVWQNQSERQHQYPTTYALHSAIKIAAGIRTEIELPGGIKAYIPDSIAFHRMDQVEFSKFYNRVCDLIAEHFLVGVTSAELKREVSAMIGVAA